MATVKCRSCGKTYRYTGDTCPSCGAYNRAPSREYVAPDGTVHLLEQGEKVCYEQKECYEHKECHEDVARQVRKRPKPAVGEVAMGKKAVRPPKLTPQKKEKTTQQRKSALLMIIGILVALVPLAGNIIDDLWDEAPPRPESIIETIPAEPADNEYDLGEVFEVGGQPVSVEKWAVAREDPSTLLVWIGQEADYDLGANLMAWEENGMSDVYCSADECFRDGKRMCYVFYDVDLAVPYGALLEIYTGDGTAAIWLGDGIGDTALSGGK